MEDWQQCSRILSHILDYTGYCGWIINARKRFYSELSRQFSQELTQYASDPRAQSFISGSKGEGLSNILQSDTDALIFHDFVAGTFEADNDVGNVETSDPTRYMFKIEKDWGLSGYYMLILASRPTQPVRNYNIECSLSTIDKGVICLQSTKWLHCVFDAELQEGQEIKQFAGPSLPLTQHGYVDFDNVPTFSCKCSSELNAWHKRPRHHDWPPEYLQQDVVSTPANVVAVGSKDDIFSQMEWRFCFNHAEQKLMHSLNTCQTKVYVVMKMILKDYLKPEKKEITSYVMKNIVFWMCEKNPSSLFKPSTLLSWIHEGLQTLKRHVETGTLPYYMIPARNLLDGKFLDGATKTLFIDKLTRLLESGACFVHVCETIQLGLELYNEGKLEDYGWKRNLTEICALDNSCRPSKADKLELLLHARVDRPVITVLLPDVYTLIAQGYNCDDMNKIIKYRSGLFLNEEKAEMYAQAESNVNK